MMNKELTNQVLVTIDKRLRDAQHITQESGYSSGWIRVLCALDRHGPLRVTEIAERINVTQQAIGKMLTCMEKGGDVSCEVCPNDHRSRIATLTTGGVASLNSIAKVWT